MHVIHDFPKQKSQSPSSLVIGNFDGVHKGHAKLIETAASSGFPVTIITFDPHPRNFFKPGSLEFINHKLQKYDLLESKGVKQLLELKFDSALANVQPEDFIKNILLLNPKHVVMGQGFKFGKNQRGNEQLLRQILTENDIQLHVLPPVKVKEIPVSSTLIRKYIKNGELQKAAEMLGYNFTLYGEVVHGKGIGRKLGFPTANIKTNQILPPSGVYATSCFINGTKYAAALSIGKNLTVNNDGTVSEEVHIFDFKGDLYGKFIKTEILYFIRQQIKFRETKELTEQIKKDIKQIRKYFENAE